jgi:hypothetical protein
MKIKRYKFTKQHKENMSKGRRGKNNPAWQNGITKKIHHCKECGKIICYPCARFGSGLCQSCCKKGKRHWNFKGKYKGKDGYTKIYIPYHPNRTKLHAMLLEHRIIMESFLNKISVKKWIEFGLKNNYPKSSRFLTRYEIVHHINGIRDDNRIENLMLVNTKNHERHTLEKRLQKRIRELERLLNEK